MAHITHIHNEAKRGCGYRKQGGMYMMAGAASIPCGKLPFALTICPCCGGGIKPARSWTWFSPKSLLGEGPCERIAMTAQDCVHCISANPPDRAGLLWIGEKFYKSPADFLAEGASMGLSRRISALPKDFKVGETWVYFAHRKTISAIEKCEECDGKGTIEVYHVPSSAPDGTVIDPDHLKCEKCDGAGKVETWTAGIFSAFRPNRVEYVVKDDDTEEFLERQEKRGLTLVRLTWDKEAKLLDAAD